MRGGAQSVDARHSTQVPVERSQIRRPSGAPTQSLLLTQVTDCPAPPDAPPPPLAPAEAPPVEAPFARSPESLPLPHAAAATSTRAPSHIPKKVPRFILSLFLWLQQYQLEFRESVQLTVDADAVVLWRSKVPFPNGGAA